MFAVERSWLRNIKPARCCIGRIIEPETHMESICWWQSGEAAVGRACAEGSRLLRTTVPSSRTAASATFALNSGLCFFRVFDKSHRRPNGRAQAGLSLSNLSSFRGPPQVGDLDLRWRREGGVIKCYSGPKR
jgi:hypothetical protein